MERSRVDLQACGGTVLGKGVCVFVCDRICLTQAEMQLQELYFFN